jgi:hypothetical protein
MAVSLDHLDVQLAKMNAALHADRLREKRWTLIVRILLVATLISMSFLAVQLHQQYRIVFQRLPAATVPASDPSAFMQKKRPPYSDSLSLTHLSADYFLERSQLIKINPGCP